MGYQALRDGLVHAQDELDKARQMRGKGKKENNEVNLYIHTLERKRVAIIARFNEIAEDVFGAEKAG